MDRRQVSAISDDVDEELAERLEEFVYGTITVLVVIGALDGNQLGSPRDATVVIIGTAFATWLAHTFAAIIGAHIRERRSVRRREVVTNFRRSWRIIMAALPATAAVLVADLGLISLRAALSAATLIGVVQLVWVGIIAARRSQWTFFGVVVYAATAALIGLVIVAIELAVFH